MGTELFIVHGISKTPTQMTPCVFEVELRPAC